MNRALSHPDHREKAATFLAGAGHNRFLEVAARRFSHDEPVFQTPGMSGNGERFPAPALESGLESPRLPTGANPDGIVSDVVVPRDRAPVCGGAYI